MMALSLRQIIVLLACTGGFSVLLGQFNHALSPFAITLTAPGLLVVFAALRLPLRTGLILVGLTGLWLDASAPEAFGRDALLLGLAFCVLHGIRVRLPREELLVGVVAALFINLGVFAALALLDLGGLPDPGTGALRLLADLIASQLVTILLGPWFLALQSRALDLVGAGPSAVAFRRYS